MSFFSFLGLSFCLIAIFLGLAFSARTSHFLEKKICSPAIILGVILMIYLEQSTLMLLHKAVLKLKLAHAGPFLLEICDVSHIFG